MGFAHKGWARAALACAGFGLVTGSCLTGPAPERPFSEGWAFDQDWAAERRALKEKTQKDELVLLGKEGGVRAAVRTDEKGRPRFNVGKQGGLSADVDIDSDEAEVELKYKLYLNNRRDRPRK